MIKRFVDAVGNFLPHLILFLSPTLAVAVQTVKATREEGFRDNPLTVTDPGHRRIRLYDKVVLLTTYFVCGYLFLFNSNMFSRTSWEMLDDGGPPWARFIILMLFPNFNSGWVTFLLWTVFFAFLRFYDSKRMSIIRETNVRAGVW